MTLKKIEEMSDFYIQTLFGGIPRIGIEIVDEETNEEIYGCNGKFSLKPNKDYDIKNDDLYNSEIYRRKDKEIYKGLYINKNDEESWEDPYNHPDYKILINKDIINDRNEVVATLLHELAHYYCWYSGLDWDDKSKSFQKILDVLGIPGNYERKVRNGKKIEIVFDYSKIEEHIKDFDNYKKNGKKNIRNIMSDIM